MKTKLTILMMLILFKINAQDIIKTDYPLNIPYATNPEIYFNASGKAIVFDNNYYQDLAHDLTPNDNDTQIYISQSFSGVNVLQVAHFATDYYVLFWSCYYYDIAFSQNRYRLVYQVFNYEGDSISPALILDENLIGFSNMLYASKLPDSDNEIGVAWAVTDTIFCAYLNFDEETASEKKSILTGTGANYWFVADFQTDGSKRLVWLDINGNIRHKKLSKTGNSLINETLLIESVNISYPALKRYNSTSEGKFYLSLFCTHPVTSKYGIEILRYNDDATNIGDPVWVTETIDNISVWDSEEMFCIDVQEDGKIVAVWSEYFDYPNSFLYMQLIDASGNKYGRKIKATTVNDETYKKGGYSIIQFNPSVSLRNDTIIMLWINYNNEISVNYMDYMNVQKYTMPEETDIPANIMTDLQHNVIFDKANNGLVLQISVDKSAEVIIDVTDILGRLSKKNESLQGGENSIPLNDIIKSNFSGCHGIYIYTINLNGEKYSGKFIY